MAVFKRHLNAFSKIHHIKKPRLLANQQSGHASVTLFNYLVEHSFDVNKRA